jgi:hypothetical protein
MWQALRICSRYFIPRNIVAREGVCMRRNEGPHPEERVLARVSKDGNKQGRSKWPSFEMAAQEGGLLRMRSPFYSQALREAMTP